MKTCPKCNGTGTTNRGGQWYRPGAWFQARGLGLWPASSDSIWSESLWEACVSLAQRPIWMSRHNSTIPQQLPELGVDCSTGKASDFMAIHGRWATASILHETSNTMDPARIFTRIKEACDWLVQYVTARRPFSSAPVNPKHIRIKIDDDGTGNAVTAFLLRERYNAVAIGAGTKATDPTKYPRKRDELWFASADKAKAGLVYLGGEGIDRETRQRLRQQLMAPAWKLDGAGRRCVEPKDETKEKIGRSPDDADALLLAFYDAPDMGMSLVEVAPRDHSKGGSEFSKRMRR